MVALNSNMQQQAFFNIDCGNEMEKIFNRNKIPLLKQKNISQMWPIISLKDIVMPWSKENEANESRTVDSFHFPNIKNTLSQASK